MRIHRLEIEAFGPFAGVQAIDFDRLSAQGLFLLNGATGAGKTSILDAICFALYGSVPGARQDGKRLRSDHAGPAVEPRVVCEFSARGRRFEVIRSPAWDRPSVRGRNGFTTQQAKTLLRECVSGNWEERSSRNDEVGAELADVLGMDREQFTRVVMLPQGDFAAFLRSKAPDRLELLQKLFGTQRFEAIEQQLSRQAAAARAAVEGNDAGLQLLLRRAEAEHSRLDLQPEAASASPEGLAAVPGAVLPGVAAPGAGAPGGTAQAEEPEAWLERLEAGVREESVRRQFQARAAEITRVQLDDRLQAAREQALRQSRYAAALVRRKAQDEAVAEALENKGKLERHRRAAVLGGHLDAVDAAERSVRLARATVEELGRKIDAASLDAADPLVALQAADALNAVLEARLPDETQLEGITARLATLENEVKERKAASARMAEDLAGLRAEETALTAVIEPLEASAANLAELEQRAAAADALVQLVDRHAAAVSVLEDATRAHGLAKEESLGLRQDWLDLREARLKNAAAELAAELLEGRPCPVCGSAEHPHPAGAAVSALIMAKEEESARRRFDASEKIVAECASELSAAAQTVAGLAAQGGSTEPGEAAAAATAARTVLAAARIDVLALSKSRNKLARLAEKIVALEIRQLRSGTDAVRAGAEIGTLREQHGSLETLIGKLREGFDTLRDRIEDLAVQRGLLRSLVTAHTEHERSLQTRAGALLSLEKALPSSGFGTPEEARRELLTSAEVSAIEAAVDAFAAENARLAELFESEDLVLAAKEVSIGETALTAGALAAMQAEATAAGATARAGELSAGLAGKAAETLADIRAEYLELAAAGREPREHSRILTELADTARGAGDNSYRMSLNSYVLAARLEQVAAAASERLVAMSDGRYTLRHSDARAARGARSGLGLEVVDEWTGQHRDTATLSGGESFMASLSLALGLADVVQQEAGGVDIETLFVDEGFGSLDEQALEQVMDALEGLRDGGRVVGLVSHVAEMKQRISNQLQVVKGRNGSTVRIAELATA